MNHFSPAAERDVHALTGAYALWGGRWQHFEHFCEAQVTRCQDALEGISRRYRNRLDALHENEGTRATWVLEVRH